MELKYKSFLMNNNIIQDANRKSKSAIEKFYQEFVILKEQKNQAYSERNQLVAVLSKIYPSWLERHPSEDKTWEDDWRNIVFIDTPNGQCSWHIHDSELKMFNHLEAKIDCNSWDGHTTEEKYKRLNEL